MIEEILNMELSDIELDILKETPEKLEVAAGCGINKGSGQCG